MGELADSRSGERPPIAAELLVVQIGGGIGALLRFALAEALVEDPAKWPWHTLIANVAACAILSFAIAHRESGRGGDRRLLLIGSGFCGGLSTFSALQLEVYMMFEAGHALMALAYLAVSVLAGLLTISTARRFVARGEDLA